MRKYKTVTKEELLSICDNNEEVLNELLEKLHGCKLTLKDIYWKNIGRSLGLYDDNKKRIFLNTELLRSAKCIQFNTLIHEIAHVIQYYNYRLKEGTRFKKIQMKKHGKEWKSVYYDLLNQFCPRVYTDNELVQNYFKSLIKHLPAREFQFHLNDNQITNSGSNSNSLFYQVGELSNGSTFEYRGYICTKIKNLQKRVLAYTETEKGTALVKLPKYVFVNTKI
ncbi:MAG: hypothetical protein QXE78_02170 [Nitrososphaeria archaeon]